MDRPGRPLSKHAASDAGWKCRAERTAVGRREMVALASDRKATSNDAIKRAINQPAILSSINDACYTDTAV